MWYLISAHFHCQHPESIWSKSSLSLSVRKVTSLVNSHAAVLSSALRPHHYLRPPITSLHLRSRPLSRPRISVNCRGGSHSAELAFLRGLEHAYCSLPQALQHWPELGGLQHCWEQEAALPGAGDCCQWAKASSSQLSYQPVQSSDCDVTRGKEIATNLVLKWPTKSLGIPYKNYKTTFLLLWFVTGPRSITIKLAGSKNPRSSQ